MVACRSNGFTLVEAAVALTLVALALVAAGRAVSLSIESAAELRLRVLAGIVAQNRLADLAARRAWPAPGRREGTEEQGGIVFSWHLEIAETPHPDLRRVEVRVQAPGGDRELRRLVGIAARDY